MKSLPRASTPITIGLCPVSVTLAALVVFALLLAACGSGESGTTAPSASYVRHGRLLASGDFTGERTSIVRLSARPLEERLRVSMELDGPRDASAVFILHAETLDRSTALTSTVGPLDSTNIDASPRGLTILIDEPGEYRVSFQQVVHPREAPGYDVHYEITTGL